MLLSSKQGRTKWGLAARSSNSNFTPMLIFHYLPRWGCYAGRCGGGSGARGIDHRGLGGGRFRAQQNVELQASALVQVRDRLKHHDQIQIELRRF